MQIYTPLNSLPTCKNMIFFYCNTLNIILHVSHVQIQQMSRTGTALDLQIARSRYLVARLHP